jgi:SAM-dependent methyltransferase
LGCGHDIRPGWINVDSASLPGVDVVHDLDDLPLPFNDAQFTQIVCQDVLEHVHLVPVMRELHRILAAAGRLRVRVPHFTSRMCYVDPTHRTAFSCETLDFFVASSRFDRGYYFDFAFSEIESARITFERRWQPWNRLVEPLINGSPRRQRYYEATFLARLFPAMNVELALVR